MERKVIGQLDKVFAHVMEHEPSILMYELHKGAQSLRQLVDAKAESVNPSRVVIAFMDEIKFRLNLEQEEAFLELKVLPPHISHETNPDHETSRFLMVNARSSYLGEKANNPNPTCRIRAFFLLLGEESFGRMNFDSIFPQFVVTDATSENRVPARHSYLFHASPIGNYPIGGKVPPRLITEEVPYGHMAQEMALAEAVLTQGAIYRG